MYDIFVYKVIELLKSSYVTKLLEKKFSNSYGNDVVLIALPIPLLWITLKSSCLTTLLSESNCVRARGGKLANAALFVSEGEFREANVIVT